MSTEELTRIVGPVLTVLIILLALAGKAFGRISEEYPVLGPLRINKKALPETVILLIIVAAIWLLGR